MKQTIYKITILSIFFLSYCLLPLSSRVKAAGFDLSVSPPIFQIELTPPAVADVKQTITLENNGDDPLDLQLVFRPFKPKGENGELEYLKEGESPGNDPEIFTKISLLQNNQPVDKISLPPKTKRQYDLAVTIPKNEPPDDYYFSIVFISQEQAGLSNKQVSGSEALGGVGMNVLLSIGPKGKTSGSIEEFSTDFIHDEGPVPFVVKIKNTSKHFIYPKGQIVITNMFGQTIGKVDLLPVNILSNSTRALPSKEQFVLTAQETNSKTASKKPNKTIQRLLDNPEAPIALWPEKFLLGPYKATLTIALSDEGPLYTREISFVGMPITVLIGFVIAMLILLAIRARLKYRGK